MTISEIGSGIEFVSDVGRRADLTDWLTHKVRPMFAQRILPVTEDIVLKWRLLMEHGRKARYTFSQPDLLIAATSLEHGLTLASRNSTDFEQARVPVFDPWSSAPGE